MLEIGVHAQPISSQFNTVVVFLFVIFLFFLQKAFQIKAEYIKKQQHNQLKTRFVMFLHFAVQRTSHSRYACIALLLCLRLAHGGARFNGVEKVFGYLRGPG